MTSNDDGMVAMNVDSSSSPSPAQMAQQQQNLTSTTAPGKVFSSRKDLQDHYRSDWHRYNL